MDEENGESTKEEEVIDEESGETDKEAGTRLIQRHTELIPETR